MQRINYNIITLIPVMCFAMLFSGCSLDKKSKVAITEQENNTEIVEETEDVNYGEISLATLGNVYSGGGTTSIIDSEGNLFVCGHNSHGQLGETTSEQKSTYTPIMTGVKFVCGSASFAAITVDNSLHTWGYNAYNQLGYGSADSSEPTRIAKKIIDVAMSDSTCAYVTKNGDMYAIGYPRVSFGDKDNTRESSTPIKIMGNVLDVELSTNNDYGKTFAAITQNHDLYLWGDNEAGIIIPGTEEAVAKPTKVMDNVKSVSLGKGYVLAVTTNNELYAWGTNHVGQLGLGNTEATTEKTKVMDNIVLADAGSQVSLAVNEAGELFTWGGNSYGVLGQGIDPKSSKDRISSPVKIMDNVKSASVDGATMIILNHNGDVYTCGWNSSGQLGTGDKEDRNVPTLVYNIYESN